MTEHDATKFPARQGAEGVADYTAITELPGSGLTPEQWARIHHRYALARDLAQNRRVLEVACGAGVGLPALAQIGQMVVGGDYTGGVLEAAHAGICAAGAPVYLAQYDAQNLPFADHSFDLILIFEAVYYLHDPAAFLTEARRILRPGGTLLIGTENPSWPAFTPGKLSTRYWNFRELHTMMAAHGFDAIQGWGAFPVTTYSPRQQQIARLRRYLLRRKLVPTHPVARRILQQISYGKMYNLPPFLAETDLTHAPVTALAEGEANADYKVFYLQGRA